jgi:hypothetical protein
VASFKFTKLRSGVYKVVPDTPLEPGEYCSLSAAAIGTFAAGGAGASRLFDFGIIPAEQARVSEGPDGAQLLRSHRTQDSRDKRWRAGSTR